MKIKAAQDGPFLVPGPLTYTDAEGKTHTAEGKTIALCRCGHSANKPFCDGSHKRAGFQAEAVTLELPAA